MTKVSEKLWEDNQHLIQLSLNSKFIQGLLNVALVYLKPSNDASNDVSNIAEGLNLKQYTHYMKQDTYYLECYSRAYAYCLARTETATELDYMKLFLDGVFSELEFHRFYVTHVNQIVNQIDSSLNISEEFQIAPATEAYTRFLLQSARDQPLPCVIAAMVPCTRLYLYLGKQLRSKLEIEAGDQLQLKGGLDYYANPKILKKDVQSNSDKLEVGLLYLNWIQKYSDQSLVEVCDKLEGLLNDLLAKLPKDDPIHQTVAENYNRSMQLEFEFFEQSTKNNI